MSDTRRTFCEHGAAPGECVEEGCLFRKEVKDALLMLAGATTAAVDQADAMTLAELGERLQSGRWSTVEVHEAARRLIQVDSALGWLRDFCESHEQFHAGFKYMRRYMEPLR